MKLRRGHWFVLALIGLMTAINGYLVVFVIAPPQSVPEVAIPDPPHFVALVKKPTERPVPVQPYSTTTFVGYPNKQFTFSSEPIQLDIKHFNVDGFRLFPKKREFPKVKPTNELKLVRIGGVEPMPFGESSFGPWDMDRDYSPRTP